MVFQLAESTGRPGSSGNISSGNSATDTHGLNVDGNNTAQGSHDAKDLLQLLDQDPVGTCHCVPEVILTCVNGFPTYLKEQDKGERHNGRKHSTKHMANYKNKTKESDG